jgi:hypothetical protein
VCVMCGWVSREENKTSCTSSLTGAVKEEIEQVSCSPCPLGYKPNRLRNVEYYHVTKENK